MFKIEAIINPSYLEKVKNALTEIGINGMTVLEARGFGHEQKTAAVFRGVEYQIDLLPKLKIEVLVEDAIRDICVKTIADAARSGNIGDGKIFTTRIESLTRIRTGEKQSKAL